MSKNLRITNSKFIDQTSRISFKFNGQKLYGFKKLLTSTTVNACHPCLFQQREREPS